MSISSTRVLHFAKPEPQAYIAVLSQAVADGVRLIRLYPDHGTARELIARSKANFSEEVRFEYVHELPGQIPSESGEVDSRVAYVLLPDRGEELPELLLQFLDWNRGWLIAPQTDRYFALNPLFLISIPKAGTHLLYNLARRMGYRDGVELVGFPEPAYWYCLEFSNSHTAAPDFFIDTVRRSPFGNRAHPFPRTPTLMIYRNPLDILVSEANWYHRDGNASFYGYLSGLSFEERVDRLISDPWLLGSIRDRIGKFLAWLEFPNVIPLSFEELVGTRGGGDDRTQGDLIWSLQLKLQVPGRPEDIATGLFNEGSPTFFKGSVGGYRDALSNSAFAKFRALDQDFVEILGYSGSDKWAAPFPPRRSEEFRRRSLRLSVVNQDEMPIAVEVFLGCNLVRFRGRFYAVPQRLGDLNLAELERTQLDKLISARALSDLKNLVLLGREHYDRAWKRAMPNADGLRESPFLLQSDYQGFNLIAYEGKVWAAEMSAGKVDFTDGSSVRALEDNGHLFSAETLEVARLVVQQKVAKRQSKQELPMLRQEIDQAVQTVDGLKGNKAEARAKKSWWQRWSTKFTFAK